MKTCKKCGTTEHLTTHHNYPVIHFGRKRNHETTILCETCHRRVESYILAIESFINKAPYGRRYRLEYYQYRQIKEVLAL